MWSTMHVKKINQINNTVPYSVSLLITNMSTLVVFRWCGSALFALWYVCVRDKTEPHHRVGSYPILIKSTTNITKNDTNCHYLFGRWYYVQRLSNWLNFLNFSKKCWTAQLRRKCLDFYIFQAFEWPLFAPRPGVRNHQKKSRRGYVIEIELSRRTGYREERYRERWYQKPMSLYLYFVIANNFVFLILFLSRHIKNITSYSIELRTPLAYWINRIIVLIIMRDGQGACRRLLDLLAGCRRSSVHVPVPGRLIERARAACINLHCMHMVMIWWSGRYISSSQPAGRPTYVPTPQWCGYGRLQVATTVRPPIHCICVGWPPYPPCVHLLCTVVAS